MNQNQPIKICMVIDREHTQSESQLLLNLATNIDKNKFEVEVLTTGDSWLTQKIASLNLKVNIFETAGFSLGRNKKLAAMLIEKKYEIVHTIGPEADNLMRSACAKAKVKIVSSINHIYEIDRKSFYKNLKQNSKKNQSAKIIFPTQTLAENFAKKNFASNYNSEIISAGVDTEQFEIDAAVRENARWDLELYSNQTAVFFIGELTEESGIGTFLKMVSKLMKDEISPTFFVVGKGPQERLVNRFCIRARSADIKYLGVESSIERYYQAADICVVPRKCEDSNFEILQALACEVPIVASRMSGIEELVESGKNALLAPSSDAEAFARAVRALVNNEPMRKMLAENSHEKIATNYKLSAIIEKYEALYLEL